MNKFIDFIDYLKREQRDDFYIDLVEIERIIGQPLSKSAYVHAAYWCADGVHAFAMQIYECGFKVSPDLRNKRIRLVRLGTDLEQKKSAREVRQYHPRQTFNLPKPSPEIVEEYLSRWDSLEDYVAQESAIDRLFLGEFNSNDNLEHILITCSVLNDFYSTNIFKVFPVAKHILSLNIDERLKTGDPTLVDEIARVDFNGEEKFFYSFASKYCSHHNPLEYPIYDSYVRKVLKHYKDVDRFYNFNEFDLKNYATFKEILIHFREFYKLDKYNLKELDKYLWQFGKEHFPNNY